MFNVFKIVYCGCEFCSDVDLYMIVLILELCCIMMIDKKYYVNVGVVIWECVLF